jgi:hypothetical protein
MSPAAQREHIADYCCRAFKISPGGVTDEGTSLGTPVPEADCLKQKAGFMLVYRCIRLFTCEQSKLHSLKQRSHSAPSLQQRPLWRK